MHRDKGSVIFNTKCRDRCVKLALMARYLYHFDRRSSGPQGGCGRDRCMGPYRGTMQNSVCGDVRSVYRTVTCRAAVGNNATDG